jgi:hypothetical protein
MLSCLNTTMKTPRSTALNEQFAGKWHITRWPNGELDAAQEPHRAYHVLEAHPAVMRATLARVERNGGRLVIF